MSAAVDVRDAFRIYQTERGASVALQGLTLRIDEGEIVVLLGPSGSGKSTLLRVLAGLETLSAGSARVLGAEPARFSPAAAAAFRQRHLGLLDQHYARSLSRSLTCRQNVELQLALLGHGPRERERQARALLDEVGLGDRAGERPTVLSGGEQQRVAVCAAVAHRPGLLLADEPAGELDAESAATVYAVLARLVHEVSGSALIVSHDRAAADVADRIVEVRDGRIVQESAPGGPARLVLQHGWVRLPDSLTEAAGIGRLAAAGTQGGELILSGAGEPRQETPAATAAAPLWPAQEVSVAELRDVHKRYGEPDGAGRTVLDGLTHAFAAGRLSAVVGRSGSGKTTLLHLLAGLELPDAGEVLVLGQPLPWLDRAALARRRRSDVALVTQEPGLVPFLDPVENIALALSLRGTGNGGHERARAALAAVGLERRLHERVGRLSAGERQRVAIARALAAAPPLILADEPTARLDEEHARDVAHLLVDAARERGTAIVCATHDWALIEQADDVLRLD